MLEYEFHQLLHEIHKDIKLIMTAIDDLNQAITDLSTSIDNEISALTTALTSNNDAAIETAVSNLKTLNSKLQASVPAPAPVQATPAQ